jgi:hypothetical protein
MARVLAQRPSRPTEKEPINQQLGSKISHPSAIKKMTRFSFPSTLRETTAQKAAAGSPRLSHTALAREVTKLHGFDAP